MPWTPEGRAFALEKYGDLSASAIAKIVNAEYGCSGVTRNAVIGIAARNGKSLPVAVRAQRNNARLLERAKAARSKRPLKTSTHPAWVYTPKKAPPPALPSDKAEGVLVKFTTRPLPPAPIEEPLNVTLLELEPGQCRAPVGQNDEGQMIFCGRAQAVTSDGRGKRSWCAGHAAKFHEVHVRAKKGALWVPADGRAVAATPTSLKALLAG